MQFRLKNLEIPTHIGVYESEKGAPQKLVVNVWFEADTSEAQNSDQLEDTVDYAQLEALIRRVCAQKHYQLLEHLHECLMQAINTDFPALKNVAIRLEKFPFENGSIEIS